MADLSAITPAKLSDAERQALFQHFYRRLIEHRNNTVAFIIAEANHFKPEVAGRIHKLVQGELDGWAQALLESAWATCEEPGGGSCPKLTWHAEVSPTNDNGIPAQAQISQTLNTILFLHITGSKSYSAQTRTFFASIAPTNENAIVTTLKNPDDALKQAQTDRTKAKQASKGKALRYAGMGLAGVAGGVLIGVTGGLAAPLVGGAVSTVLGFLGVGGTAAGLLASGLAGSSVICGTLFGVYGATTSANIVKKHTQEVRDLGIVPIRPAKDRLAVRLCISGWLDDEVDVVAPWTIFGDDCDNYALRWEVKALKDLAKALKSLVKSSAIGFLQLEVVKRTALAGLMAALSPLLLLQIEKIINNPWRHARALAIKAGAVLGKLLQERVFGQRPVVLTGYSLGALVIFEALKYLASLHPQESMHLVQDVFLFGLPVPVDARIWTSVRRVVAGRLVNGYCERDYVLAVLSRASSGSWGIAGLAPVDVRGVENVNCAGVEGHLKWRGHIGECLRGVNAPGLLEEEVEEQIRMVGKPLDEEIETTARETEKVIKEDEHWQDKLKVPE